MAHMSLERGRANSVGLWLLKGAALLGVWVATCGLLP